MTSGLLEPASMSAVHVQDEETLSMLLAGMQRRGEQPVVIGLDRFGVRFLAYANGSQGDQLTVGVVVTDSAGFDDTAEHCVALQRRSATALTFPVVTA